MIFVLLPFLLAFCDAVKIWVDLSEAKVLVKRVDFIYASKNISGKLDCHTEIVDKYMDCAQHEVEDMSGFRGLKMHYIDGSSTFMKRENHYDAKGDNVYKIVVNDGNELTSRL